jgi:hypothetical protein
MSPVNQDPTGFPQDLNSSTGPLPAPRSDGEEPAARAPHRRCRPQRNLRRNDRAGAAGDQSLDPAPAPLRSNEHRGRCVFGGPTTWHHDRLIAIDDDPDGLLELIELAVTWAELDYSTTPVIPPHRWMSFLHSHHWPDPHRAERILSIATHMAMTATRTGGGRPAHSASLDTFDGHAASAGMRVQARAEFRPINGFD